MGAVAAPDRCWEHRPWAARADWYPGDWTALGVVDSRPHHYHYCHLLGHQAMPVIFELCLHLLRFRKDLRLCHYDSWNVFFMYLFIKPMGA